MSFARKDWKNYGEQGYEDSKLNADNLNNLETRIENGFEEVFQLQDISDSTDYNDFLKPGYYQCNFQGGTNAPHAYATGMLLVLAKYYISQLFLGQLNKESVAYFRNTQDGGKTWSNWKQL